MFSIQSTTYSGGQQRSTTDQKSTCDFPIGNVGDEIGAPACVGSHAANLPSTTERASGQNERVAPDVWTLARSSIR
jgi:hypothetical protein